MASMDEKFLFPNISSPIFVVYFSRDTVVWMLSYNRVLIMKNFFRFLLFLALLPILLVIAMLVWMQVADYQPESIEIVSSNTNNSDALSDTITLLTWNLGYGGLGDDMDFFYDGGTKMQTTQNRTEENLKGIRSFIQSEPELDVYLFQEVDKHSKRSWYINQVEFLNHTFPEYYYSYFAYNYKVKYVPTPISNPMGKVESGLYSVSYYKPEEVVRYAFDGQYAWPKNLFMLDRCFLVQKYLLLSGDTLLIVNTHNTAYDDGGIRRLQMEQLKQWLLDKASSGHRIIVGGDWNQIPDGIDPEQFGTKTQNTAFQVVKVPDGFLPKGWHWAYDSSRPTNRSLNTPYSDSSYQNVLDYFLVSPGLEIIEVKTLTQQFKCSDHEPVYIKVAYKIE